MFWLEHVRARAVESKYEGVDAIKDLLIASNHNN